MINNSSGKSNRIQSAVNDMKMIKRTSHRCCDPLLCSAPTLMVYNVTPGIPCVLRATTNSTMDIT